MTERTEASGEEPEATAQTVDPLGRTLAETHETSRLRTGDAVGRYLILGVLGEGGMAIVYKGYDPELDRRVAIKLVTVDSSEPPDVDPGVGGRRLLREAQAMAQLAHPNVVAVYDVGMHGEQVFIAMELVARGTVGAWLRERPRGWREILDVFLQAGRGLEAAHAVKLVHRDVKPSNMLLGHDGRVRVTDFGIVKRVDVDAEDEPRVEARALAPERPSDVALAGTMTRAGSMMGTVGYMAPEQIDGRPVDARTDQYGFCVSLYRALYGTAPFDPTLLVQSRAEATVPKDARVPSWVGAIVLRGLRLSPEERFASMHDVLAALESDPTRSRKRWLGWGGALLLVAALASAAGASVVQRRNRTAASCEGAASRLAGVWDEGRKRAVQAAFSAASVPYAADAYGRVEQALSAYAGAWLAMQTESCRATRIRGEQSAELFDLRTECLERRLDELRAETELFTRADAKVVENAVKAAGALTSLEECASVVSLRAPQPLPVDPAARSRISEVRRRLAEAKALLEAGKYESGLAVARPAADEARAIGYRPLEGEALVQLGWLEVKAGNPQKAEDTLVDALVSSEAGRHDSMSVSALTELVYVIGYVEARPKEARTLSRQAFAMLERMGDGNDELVAALHWRVGSTYYAEGRYADMLASDRNAVSLWERARGLGDPRLAIAMSDEANALGMLGRYEEALATYRRAVAIDESALGPSHPDVGQILVNVGWVLSVMKRFDEALAEDQRALRILEKTVGPNHPNWAYAENTMGWSLLGQGKPDLALEAFRRALGVWERALGPDNPRTADPLTGIGLALLGRREADPALSPLERAEAMREAHAEDALDLAETEFALARVLGELHREPARARRLAEKAREAYVAAGDHAQVNFASLADVDAWLARAK